MIEKYQLANLYKSIMQKLLFHGDVRSETVVKELENIIDTSSANFPILTPQHYEYSEKKASPFIWNQNIAAIEADLRILESAIIDFEEVENNLYNSTNVEVSNLKSRIFNLQRRLSALDDTVTNGIQIIPDYVDYSEINNTASILSDEQIITSGNLLEIFQEFITPTYMTYKVLTTHTTTSISSDLKNLYSRKSSDVIIKVISSKPITQRVEFQISLSTYAGGLYFKSNDAQAYFVSTNMSNKTFTLYDSLLIKNENKNTGDIIVTLTKHSYDEIINGKFVYYFKLNKVAAYKSIAESASLLTTTDITITDPYIKICGEISGEPSLYISINDTQYSQIDFNETIGLSTKSYISASTIITSNDGLYGIGDVSSYNTTAVDISGPIGCFEYINGKYITYLYLYQNDTVTFGVDCNISDTYKSYTIAAGSSISLQKGIYKLSTLDPTSAVISNTADIDYDFKVISKYHRIPESYINENGAYPPYTYIITDAGILYISSISLVSIYRHTSTGLSNLTPIAAVDYLEYGIHTMEDTSIKLRIILPEHSSVNNLAINTLTEGII